jgi:hypothetical protein
MDAQVTAGLPLACEMTGSVGDLLEEELIKYESELNRFVPRYPQVLLESLASQR